MCVCGRDECHQAAHFIISKGLPDGGSQGRCDAVLPLHTPSRSSRIGKQGEEERNERAPPGAKASRSNSTYIRGPSAKRSPAKWKRLPRRKKATTSATEVDTARLLV